MLVVSLRLRAQTRDASVRILGGWGAFWLIRAAWDLWLEYAYIAMRVPPSQAMQTISFLLALIGQVAVLSTAAYATWRLWRRYSASVVTGGS